MYTMQQFKGVSEYGHSVEIKQDENGFFSGTIRDADGNVSGCTSDTSYNVQEWIYEQLGDIEIDWQPVTTKL